MERLEVGGDREGLALLALSWLLLYNTNTNNNFTIRGMGSALDDLQPGNMKMIYSHVRIKLENKTGLCDRTVCFFGYLNSWM